MDCFATTSTWNTVMTKTRNIVFSKVILILTNKGKFQGISYSFVTVDYMQCLFSLMDSKAGEPREQVKQFSRSLVRFASFLLPKKNRERLVV